MNNSAQNLITKIKYHWLGLSALLFTGFFFTEIMLISVINGDWVNHIHSPVIRYFYQNPLFLFNEPKAALEFIGYKSFLIFAHTDPKSGLNLWTLDVSINTLAIHFISALTAGWFMTRDSFYNNKRKYILPLTGIILLVFAFTYMTAIGHCAGATWVGYVSLLGLGVENFVRTPYYQAALATTGVGLICWGVFSVKRAEKNNRS